MARKAVTLKPALPPSHLEAMAAGGFEAVTWLSLSARVLRRDGTEGHEWLPREVVHWEKRLFIAYRDDNAYSFAGWEPHAGHSCGGRYDTVKGALAWCAWRERQGQ